MSPNSFPFYSFESQKRIIGGACCKEISNSYHFHIFCKLLHKQNIVYSTYT